MTDHQLGIRSRRSIRLAGYDYSQPGAYFVTICTARGGQLFGRQTTDGVEPSLLGYVACRCWEQIPEHFTGVTTDAFVVMPNHIHGIVLIRERDLGPNVESAGTCIRQLPPVRRAQSLASIIGSYKSAVTKRINEIRGARRIDVWQRGYYEHIIRTEEDLNRIREYISNNPARWSDDPENTECVGLITSMHSGNTP